MKKLLIVSCALFCVVLLCGHYFGGSAVPNGQAPLVSLSAANFDQLRRSFNAASGDVRVVLLLSPT